MKGWVYFLSFGNDGPIKIGCSTDPVARSHDLNVASPVELALLGAMKSARMKREESELHDRLVAFRVRGEWFARTAVIAVMRKLRSRIVAVDDLPVTGQQMAGIRADKKTLARWRHKAEEAGMSFQKWAHHVLNNAPAVTPARIVQTTPMTMAFKESQSC